MADEPSNGLEETTLEALGKLQRDIDAVLQAIGITDDPQHRSQIDHLLAIRAHCQAIASINQRFVGVANDIDITLHQQMEVLRQIARRVGADPVIEPPTLQNLYLRDTTMCEFLLGIVCIALGCIFCFSHPNPNTNLVVYKALFTFMDSTLVWGYIFIACGLLGLASLLLFPNRKFRWFSAFLYSILYGVLGATMLATMPLGIGGCVFIGLGFIPSIWIMSRGPA